jgi:TonB family protein
MLPELILSLAFAVSPQSQPPRDRVVDPTVKSDPAAREAELTQRIAKFPNGMAAYRELSTLQEGRGAVGDAEATLLRAKSVEPKDKSILSSLAGFYNRQGNFDKTIESLEAIEQLDPTDSTSPQIIATYYWEKAYRDQKLPSADRYRYVLSGIAATDRALALKPDYVDALTYKNLLLRVQADLVTDPAQKKDLLAQADVLRNRALELRNQRVGLDSEGKGVALPPPPPPPPPASSQAPVTSPELGMRAPTKTKDVRPVYPPDAMAAKIQGVVVIEVALDTEGHVHDARVLRSIPELDEAALTAVRQWEFTPSIVNGKPVPVVMTVTVNFTLQ